MLCSILPDGINHLEKGGSNFRIEDEFAIAQATQEVFADVRDRFQFCESQESAGTLDSVDGAKNAGEPIAISGIFLELD
jgi:hypothetical protein